MKNCSKERRSRTGQPQTQAQTVDSGPLCCLTVFGPRVRFLTCASSTNPLRDLWRYVVSVRVFISWSGDQSKAIAECLKDWLPLVLQSLEPYFTPSDVDKGTRWQSEISHELAQANIGILCVTRESMNSPWLLFEAGVLSKQLEMAHVCPILFGLRPTDITGPLAQFQATEFEREDFRQLVGVLNDRLGERHLPAKTLDAVFEKFWPDLKSNIEGVIEAMPDTNQAPVRSTNEMLDEILRLVRRPRISLAVIAEAIITDLLKGYLTLHDDQVKRGSGYQGTLDHLHKMHNPIEYLIHKHAPQMEKTELVERFFNLSYKAEEEEINTPSIPSTDDLDDEMPF